MDSDTKDLVKFVAGFLLLLTAAFIVVAWLDAATCQNQWARSGLKAEWWILHGCVVQRKDGTWVPASMLRAIAQ